MQHTTKSPIFFCKSTFYTSNLSFHGTCRCVHHPKRFLLIVPLKATRDKQRFHFWLRGVQCFSAVWCTLGRLSLRSAAHYGDCLRKVMDTRSFSRYCVHDSWEYLGKLTPRCDAHRGDWLSGVMYTAEIVSAEWSAPRGFWKIWICISAKFEKEFLKYLSLCQGHIIKKWRYKISWHTLCKHSCARLILNDLSLFDFKWSFALWF